MKRPTLSLFLILVIAACGGSGSGQTPATAVDPKAEPAAVAIPSDMSVLTKAYDSNYYAPDGFFIDERAATETRSYTVHHVLDESASFERCTDDLVIAQDWEQIDNDRRAVSGNFVTSYENDRYFEFVRELSYDQDVGSVGDPTSPGYARVFKCTHTDRDGVDRNLLSGYAGLLNAMRSEDATSHRDALRHFTEYLWQFRFFDVTRKVVLESVALSPNSHVLVLAFVINQGSDQCDRIDVAEWRFAVNETSGEVSKSFETVRQFEAEVENGVPKLCQK